MSKLTTNIKKLSYRFWGPKFFVFLFRIDDLVYILTVLSFVIFLGLYHYHFIILTIVRFCYIVLYIIL